MTGYPIDKIFEEVAFIAYHFKWDHDEIVNMEHSDRIRWCEEISKINSSLNERSKEKSIEVFDDCH